MVSIEEQLLETQNKLLEWQKNEVKNTMKIDELTERADFYENLHNKEQRNLYESENERVVLKGKNKQLIIENEQLRNEVKDLQNEVRDLQNEVKDLQNEQEQTNVRIVDNIKTRQLITIMLKRMGYKITRR